MTKPTEGKRVAVISDGRREEQPRVANGRPGKVLTLPAQKPLDDWKAETINLLTHDALREAEA